MRALVGVICPLVAIVAYLVAIVFCTLCTLGSVATWFWGLCGVVYWGWKQFNHNMETPKVAVRKSSVMSSAWGIKGRLWEVAKEIVEGSDFVFL